MAKAFIPKVSFKDIDLAPYGGEGKIRVKGLSLNASAKITETMQAMALKDGYSLEDIERKSAEINARYNIPLVLTTVSVCATVDDGEGFRAFTEEELNDLPLTLTFEIYNTIMSMNAFPLVQKNGEGSKKERLKPTSVE